MSQFHYVVMYDTETDKWSVEDEGGFLDGNVWSGQDVDGEPFWHWVEEGTREEAIDSKCTNMLHSLVTIWPSPLTNGEL